MTIEQIDQDARDASIDEQISYSELLMIRAVCEVARQLERITDGQEYSILNACTGKGPDYDALPEAWDCDHIETGEQHEPMTSHADSRDSAEAPSIQ